MRSFLLMVFILVTKVAFAEVSALRAIVSDSNAPPYAIFDQEGNLAGGISKDILDLLATRSALNLQYLPIPRGRVEQWLSRNEADIACFLNPNWVEQSVTLLWSPVLFTTRQVLIRRSNSPAIVRLTDLLGKRVGTDRGFNYPEFEAVFSQRQIIRDDAISLHSNLSRLQKQRLDAVLTVDLAFAYHQQQYNFADLAADPMWTAADEVYCAINPNRPELASHLQQLLQQMVVDGSIDNILQRYKPLTKQAVTTD